MKLHKVLPHLASTYKSIDLNVACGFYEDKWVNLLTLLRFTHEDAALLNKQILENQHLMQLSKGSKFRIYRKPVPFEDLPKLTSDFLTGSIKINGISVFYDSVLDIQNFDLFFMRHYTNMSDKNWRGFFVSREERGEIRPYRCEEFYSSLKAEVIPHGAKNVFEAIELCFDLKDYRNSQADFMIIVPVYARIDNIDLEQQKVKISARYHKNLTDLFLHYGRRKSVMNQESIFGPLVYDQTKGTVTEETDFKIWQIEADQLDIANQSYAGISCDVTLFFQPLSEEVSTLQKNITEMIAEKRLLQTNPLARIFAKFCPIEKLEEILTNPTKISESGLTLSDTSNFERAVQWLFSLCGFSAIWLGKDMETIRDEQKRPGGSTDLLCYSAKERALAVVSCKTGIPENKDIDLVKNLADKFRNDMKEFGIQVVPIIASSQPCDAIRSGSQNDVDIIDVNDIKKIIEELYELPPTPGLLLRKIRTSHTIGL